MSDGEVRKVSRQDIQLVQNLIERCLQLYMNQKEVVETLEMNARIEPGFTELVWQKLEEENREFFRAYHTRLILKNQIIIFNELLQKQVEIMHGIDSNASLQRAQCYASSAPQDLAYTSGLVGPSIDPIRNEMPPMEPMSMCMPTNSDISMLHELNGAKIKMGPPAFSFCTENSFSDCHVAAGDTPVSTFQAMNEQLVDVDSSSFGILGQIPRNFSFSDLTDDFTQSSDILESYGRSPFLGPDSALSSSAGRAILGERKI